MARISFTQISSWLRCREAWGYKYVDELFQKVVSRAPRLGSAFHIGIAAAILSQDYVAAINKWAEEYKTKLGREMLLEETANLNDVIAVATGLVRRTCEHYNIPEGWETQVLNGVPMVEYEFNVPMPGWESFVGYVDWVAKDKKTGHLWLIDWKVRESLQPIENEEVNLQSAAYQYGLQQLGLPCQGTMTIQVSNALPKKPEITKKGEPSRARVRTDWPTYKAAVEELGLNPNDYLEMVEKLSDVEFWREGRSIRGEVEVNSIWNDIIVPASDDIHKAMVFHKEKLTDQPVFLYRNLNPRSCQGCNYRMLCLEGLRGGDTEFIVREHYTKSTKSQEEAKLEVKEEVDAV